MWHKRAGKGALVNFTPTKWLTDRCENVISMRKCAIDSLNLNSLDLLLNSVAVTTQKKLKPRQTQYDCSSTRRVAEKIFKLNFSASISIDNIVIINKIAVAPAHSHSAAIHTSWKQ